MISFNTSLLCFVLAVLMVFSSFAAVSAIAQTNGSGGVRIVDEDTYNELVEAIIEENKNYDESLPAIDPKRRIKEELTDVKNYIFLLSPNAPMVAGLWEIGIFILVSILWVVVTVLMFGLGIDLSWLFVWLYSGSGPTYIN